MEISQDEKQKLLEVIDKVNPCVVFSVKNLDMFKENLDSGRLKKVTFVEASKSFKEDMNDKVFLIPAILPNDENVKPIKFIFEGE